MASEPLTSHSTSTSPAPSSKKRKRQDPGLEELEVNIAAPEPPSKKALRKAKKGKHIPGKSSSKSKPVVEPPNSNDDQAELAQQSQRSEFGIWIGNLPWSASKLDLRTFLTSDTTITNDAITRIHMPTPKDSTATLQSSAKAQNKGFAYVDFSSQAALDHALSLSESLLTGRRVLIKDSKSFEGRPAKPKEDQHTIASSATKPPSKRIFVGNLNFDATKEGIKEHFSKCGEVLDVHIATFEDSGKCKGYGWVEFDTIDAGQAAIRGWVDFYQNQGQDDKEDLSSEEEEQSKPKRKPKMRKWWVNKFQGRPLRMEFAEAKEVRYKKRFGKSSASQQDPPSHTIGDSNDVKDTAGDPSDHRVGRSTGSGSQSTEPTRRSKHAAAKKIDARMIKPGAALASAPRLQGSIIASKGKKTVLA
ncbi:MAG: hypothetical protein Q9195_003297 [Heterodermia aff. obscurata]